MTDPGAPGGLLVGTPETPPNPAPQPFHPPAPLRPENSVPRAPPPKDPPDPPRPEIRLPDPHGGLGRFPPPPGWAARIPAGPGTPPTRVSSPADAHENMIPGCAPAAPCVLPAAPGLCACPCGGLVSMSPPRDILPLRARRPISVTARARCEADAPYHPRSPTDRCERAGRPPHVTGEARAAPGVPTESGPSRTAHGPSRAADRASDGGDEPPPSCPGGGGRPPPCLFQSPPLPRGLPPSPYPSGGPDRGPPWKGPPRPGRGID